MVKKFGFKSSQSQDGFTIVGMILALMGSVFVLSSISGLTNSFRNNQKKLQTISSQEDLAQAVSMTLVDGDLCKAAFSSTSLQSSVPIVNQDQSNHGEGSDNNMPTSDGNQYNGSGKNAESGQSAGAATKLSITECLGTGSRKLEECKAANFAPELALNFDPDLPITKGVDVAKIIFANKIGIIDKSKIDGRIKVKAFTVLTDATNMVHLGKVQINGSSADKVATNIVLESSFMDPKLGEKVTRTSFPLELYVDNANNKIVKCNSRKDLSINSNASYVLDVCHRMGGSFDNETLKCQFPACSAGQFTAFNGMSGKVECRNMDRVVIVTDSSEKKIGVGTQEKDLETLNWKPPIMNACYCPYVVSRDGSSCVLAKSANAGSGVCSGALITKNGGEHEYDTMGQQNILTHHGDDDHLYIEDNNDSRDHASDHDKNKYTPCDGKNCSDFLH